MNSRRKNLLLLLPVLVGVLFLGPIGSVELFIWMALTLAWLCGFFFWAANRSGEGSADKRTDRASDGRPS